MKNLALLTRKADKIAYYVSTAGAIVSGLIVAFTTIMIFANVINRQFIGQIWLFVEEYTALGMIPMAYLGMAYTLRWNKHIYVDAVITNFSPKTQTIVAILVSLFSLIVLVFMIERSWNWFAYTWSGHILSDGPMRTPLWLFSLSVVIGLIMYFFDTLFFMINKILLLIGSTTTLEFHEE